MCVAEQFDPLFIDGDRAALDAENVEEVVVKALRFALFIMGVLPFLAERLGAAFDFVPTQSHAAPIVAPDARRTDWGRQALWWKHAPPSQIGRASCRERVCQYV